MVVKNNYNECLTNLGCSIQKYFGLNVKHNSIEYIDNILNENQPKNVVLILFDGMGSRILDRTLDNNDFFIKNRIKEITTVFPATTTAATTSIRTGLNPIEHGWLGWNMYISPIDETITLFRNHRKGEEATISDNFLKIKNKLVQTTIADEINRDTDYNAIEIFPFGENPYNDLDEMLKRIEDQCNKEGKQYIYAYDVEPDYTMHRKCADSNAVKELIKTRSNKIEKLCEKLNDSIIIVIADHGHKKADHIFLKDYPEIMQMLERTTSIEQRAVSFKIKRSYADEFVKEFNKNFGEDFKLYSKSEVIENHLFGYGEENELFSEAIGDFIAIAENSSKCIITDGDKVLKSQHAGYSDDEIYVPLIVVNKC